LILDFTRFAEDISSSVLRCVLLYNPTLQLRQPNIEFDLLLPFLFLAGSFSADSLTGLAGLSGCADNRVLLSLSAILPLNGVRQSR